MANGSETAAEVAARVKAERIETMVKHRDALRQAWGFWAGALGGFSVLLVGLVVNAPFWAVFAVACAGAVFFGVWVWRWSDAAFVTRPKDGSVLVVVLGKCFVLEGPEPSVQNVAGAWWRRLVPRAPWIRANTPYEHVQSTLAMLPMFLVSWFLSVGVLRMFMPRVAAMVLGVVVGAYVVCITGPMRRVPDEPEWGVAQSVGVAA